MPESSELRIGGLSISDICGIDETGITYIAKDSSGLDVTLKVLKWEFETLDEKLCNEYALRRLKELHHPYLSPILDVGYIENGKLWFTSGYIASSESLDEILPKLDVTGAQMILLQVVDALDFLHRNGFLHGNLTAQTIRVMKGSQKQGGLWEHSKQSETAFSVKITDYALTPPASNQKGDNLLPKYLCEKKDIHDLGKIIYEAYVGKLEDGAKPELSSIREHIPEQLKMFVAKLVGVSYDEEFRSLQQAALYLSELSPKSTVTSQIEMLPKNSVMAKDSERRSFLLDMLSESTGKGRFVLIEGEEGSGKSVLVREFANSAMQNDHQVSITSCISKYSPFEPLAKFICDLENGLKDINPGILKTYGNIITRMKCEKSLDKNHIPESVFELFESFQLFLAEVTSISPILLIIEDIELASDHLLKILKHIQSGISELKMMIVCTCAPGKIRGDQQYLYEQIAVGESVSKIQIGVLDLNGIISFIRYMLASPDFPEQIVPYFYESSGGNILKIEELVKIALSDGCLARSTGGKWIFNDRRFLELKKGNDTRLIVAKSIESLSPDEQTMLRMLATLGGRSKIVDIVEIACRTKLFKSAEPDYLAHLVFVLISKGYIRRRQEAGGMYFTLAHNSYSEALLQSVMVGFRKDIYDSVCSALLQMPSYESDCEREVKIAQLALKGNDPVVAFKATPEAASACLRQFASNEARFFFTKLSQMVPEEEKSYALDCVEKLALCDIYAGNYAYAFDQLDRIPDTDIKLKALKAVAASKARNQKANVFLQETISRVDEIPDSTLKKMLISAHIEFLENNDPAQALSFATNRAQTTDDPNLKVVCLLAASKLQAALAEFETAEKLSNEASRIASESNLQQIIAKTVLWQIILSQMKDDYDKTSRLIRKSSNLIQNSWDVQTKAEYYKYASKLYLAERELDSALNYTRLWVSTLSKLDQSAELASALMELGAILDIKGHIKESQQMVERARRLAEETGDSRTIARALTFTGEHFLSAGSLDQALISFERAEKLLCEMQDNLYLAKTYEALGKIWLSQQDVEKSRFYVKQLKNLVDATYDPIQEAAYNKLQAALYAFTEKWEKAEESLIKSLDTYERKKMVREANHLKLELSDLFIKQGEFFRALSKLSEARLFFEEENSQKELKRIRTTELAIDKELGKYGEDYRNLRMLLEISKSLTQSNRLDELLPMIVDMAVKVSGAERGFVMLLTHSGKLEFSVGRNQKKENLGKDTFGFSTTVTDSVLSERKLISITDTASDEKFRAKDSIVGLSLRSIMCAPLRVQDKILGVIYVDSQVPTFYFSKKNAEFFEALCSHASTALWQAKLFEQAVSSAKLAEENRMLKEMGRQKAELVGNISEKIKEPLNRLYEISSDLEAKLLSGDELTALSNDVKNCMISIKTIIEGQMP